MGKIIKVSLFLVVVLVVSYSYYCSDKTDIESLKDSNIILEKLNLVSKEDIKNETGNYKTYSRIIRQIAHLIMYAFITMFVYLFILVLTGENILSGIVTLVFVLLYAYFDEMHQERIAGRGFERIDLIVDSFGCVIVLVNSMLVTWVNNIFINTKRAKKKLRLKK